MTQLKCKNCGHFLVKMNDGTYWCTKKFDDFIGSYRGQMCRVITKIEMGFPHLYGCSRAELQ